MARYAPAGLKESDGGAAPGEPTGGPRTGLWTVWTQSLQGLIGGFVTVI